MYKRQSCNEAIKYEKGKLIELRCTYDADTKGGRSEDGRKVRGTLHWVSVKENIKAEIRLYDRLFNSEHPEKNGDFIENINEESLKVIDNAVLERSLHLGASDLPYQFERTGYFKIDSKNSTPDKLVFNRAVSLRDSWARFNKKVG